MILSFYWATEELSGSSKSRGFGAVEMEFKQGYLNFETTALGLKILGGITGMKPPLFTFRKSFLVETVTR